MAKQKEQKKLTKKDIPAEAAKIRKDYKAGKIDEKEWDRRFAELSKVK